ncbi:MAG: ribonuclease R, partial [Thermodesulfobacteriota bacterium]
PPRKPTRPGHHGRPAPQHAARSRPLAPETPTSDQVLSLLHGQEHPLRLVEIMNSLDLERRHKRDLERLLGHLVAEDVLALTPEHAYALVPSRSLREGTLSMHPRGFGLVDLEAGEGDRTEKVLISEPDLAGGRHRDRVLVRLLPRHNRQGLVKGRIVRIVERTVSSVVGIYSSAGPMGLVTPVDDRFPFQILIKKKDALGARSGEVVVASIRETTDEMRANVEGRVIEILGDPQELAVLTRMVVRAHGLPDAFPPEVEAEAAALAPPAPPYPDRLDLRPVPHVTIDGETARDFDDAVAAEKTPDGFRLHVSIADVSHYVRPGSALDREAFRRGTSVYFPTLVLPMLPERLSNDLCSLVPDADRLAMTAILELDHQGRPRSSRFARSVIRSRARLTYTLVARILDGEPAACAEQPQLVSPLRVLDELAQQLAARRKERGAIGFELPEAEIEVAATGQVTAIGRRQRNAAHKLIEELMLAANEAVALALSQAKRPLLFRIHEPPDAVKVEEFSQFAASLGLELPRGPATPAWFGQVLDMVAGSPTEYIVNNLLLRTMKQARYAPDNPGHFGLAADHYTHFTSPIRRYPDLTVHRALGELLAHPRPRHGESAADLDQAGEFLSGREREAMLAEREVDDRFRARFMADHLGEDFQAVVSGIVAFGFFVELVAHSASALVPMADLRDDYYEWDERGHQLVGRLTGQAIRLGDLVTVTISAVDVLRGRITCTLASRSGRARGGVAAP